jgi:hypothetical protein
VPRLDCASRLGRLFHVTVAGSSHSLRAPAPHVSPSRFVAPLDAPGTCPHAISQRKIADSMLRRRRPASVPVRRAPLRWSVTRTIPTSRQDRCQRLSRWIDATMPSPTADLALATPQDQPSRVVRRSSLAACRRPVPRNGPSDKSISQKHGRRHAAAHADTVARGSRRAGASDAWLSGVTGGPARVTIQSAVSSQRVRVVESCVPREANPSDNPCERALGSSDTSQGLLDTLL